MIRVVDLEIGEKIADRVGKAPDFPVAENRLGVLDFLDHIRVTYSASNLFFLHHYFFTRPLRDATQISVIADQGTNVFIVLDTNDCQ